MNNLVDDLKKKLSSKYTLLESERNLKRTDINVLLNRVKLNRKKEIRKKFYFSAATSAGLILFGLLVFG